MITKRADGLWEARVSLPDGKRRCFYGKTRQEVQRKLAQARRSLDDGLPMVDERQTEGNICSPGRKRRSYLSTLVRGIPTKRRYAIILSLPLVNTRLLK